MKNSILNRNEDGMCINMEVFVERVQKDMQILENAVEIADQEVIPAFDEHYGWFLHTNTVGAWPLTKYCDLQEIYQISYAKMHQSMEISLCEMVRLFTKEQLEIVLQIVFNA